MRGVRIALVLVLFAGFAAVPAQAAKKSESFAFFLKKNAGGGSKLLMKEGGFKLEGGCSNGDGTEITLTGTGPGTVLNSGLTGSPLLPFRNAVQNTQEKVNTVLGSTNETLGESVLYQDSEEVVILEYLTTPNAGKDCTAAGVMTIVRGKQKIYRTVVDNSTTAITNRPEPLLGMTCIGDDVTLDATATGSNAFGASAIKAPPEETALFPLGTTSNVLGPTSLFYIGSMNLSKPSGRVTSIKAGARSLNPNGCVIAGRVQSAKKATQAQYAEPASLTEERSRFFDATGLQLHASCQAGRLRVYASTKEKNAVIHTSVLGSDPPIVAADNDFDSKASNPFFVLDLDNIHRSGLLIYTSAKGRVTTINWSAAATQPGAYEPCLFWGVANSGP